MKIYWEACFISYSLALSNSEIQSGLEGLINIFYTNSTHFFFIFIRSSEDYFLYFSNPPSHSI